MRNLLIIGLLVISLTGRAAAQRTASSRDNAEKRVSVEFCAIVEKPSTFLEKKVKTDVSVAIGTTDGLKDPLENAYLIGDDCEIRFNLLEIESEGFKKRIIAILRSEMLCIDGADPWNCSLRRTFLMDIEVNQDGKPRMKIIGITSIDEKEPRLRLQSVQFTFEQSLPRLAERL